MAIEKINLTLPSHILTQLNYFAEELNEKESDIITSAFENYYNYLDIKVAEKRVKEETYTLNEIRKELEL